MLKEIFLGRPPSHFHINPLIKAFIISETFLWSAWNFIMPIIAIFATSNIVGGNVEIAASAFSVHLIVRVIFELISGRYLSTSKEIDKFLATILGILLISFSYFGFALTGTVIFLYIFYGIAGMGLGIASPAKNTLFSTHLDKNKEVFEWGVHDAVVIMGMALSAALGGFIASKYGFQALLFLASTVNLLGIVPYILYIHHKKGEFSS